jgi:hypothetical protein
MRRRTLLRAVAGVAAVTAGCTGGDPGDGSGRSASPSPSSSPSPTDTPAVTDSSFELRAVDWWVGRGDATVAVDAAVVTVDGVLVGSDGCARARLESVDYPDGTLAVAVESYSEAGICKDCIVDVRYTATVRTTRAPERVVVTHDGQRVAGAPATE